MQLHIIVECETTAGRLRRSSRVAIENTEEDTLRAAVRDYKRSLRLGRLGARGCVDAWAYLDGELLYQGAEYTIWIDNVQPGMFDSGEQR